MKKQPLLAAALAAVAIHAFDEPAVLLSTKSINDVHQRRCFLYRAYLAGAGAAAAGAEAAAGAAAGAGAGAVAAGAEAGAALWIMN